MKTNLAIISLLIGISACQDLSPLLGYCANPPKTLPKTLSDKIALPTFYRISGSVTNWKEASTSLITETGSEEYRVFEKHSRALLPEKWIQSLSGDKQFMLVNLTSGDCQVAAAKPDIFPNMPRFKSIIGDDHSSVYSIIQGLIEFDKTHAGFLAEDHRVEVVGGVNSIKWVTCVSGATSNDSVVLVEVRYAGEDAISPAQSQFSNPLLLSIRLAELPNFNSTVPINHISIEIDRYEVPTSYDPSVAHGVYCENRTFVTLPLKPLEEYAAVLNYFDHAKNRSEVVEVFYSKSRQIFIVAGDSFENGVKILKSSPDRYPNGTDYILHDFKYGYEFTMSREACESFSSLDNSTEDVFYDKSSILTLKPMERLLVDSALSWSAYQNDVDMYGKSYKTFRAFDPRDETIQELHLTDDGEVISIATFRMGSRHLTVTVTVTRIPMESSRLNLKAAQLSNCYDDGKFANNTWIMQMKDKKLSDVSKVGINRLNEAVAESISKNVYPVIPYRIVVFYVENKDHGLSIILRIAEKTEKMPAPVVGYNYTAELTNFELFNMLNNSIALEKMPIEVQTVDGAKEEWMAVANTVRMFSPGNDTGFIGYTGGSMFVLAIFCLIIGVTIGTVGLFVVTRRQRISTLAYQVFE